jgi:sortase B
VIEMKLRKNILFIILSSILLYSSANIGCYIYDFYSVRNQVKVLEQLMESTDSELISVPTSMLEEQAETFILPEFKDITKQNDDFIGWLKIENTPISYPVMYTPEDADFYLDHDFDKQNNKNGMPFLDYRCSIEEPTTNWIIYGHNMKNGSMFHSLLNYKDEAYYKEHPVIQFNTLNEKSEYEITSVFMSKVYQKEEDVFKYYEFIKADTQTEFNQFIDNINSLSLYNTDVETTFGDQLITLSTCDYTQENGRMVIVARKRDAKYM